MRIFVESYGCTLNQGEGLEINRSLSANHSTVPEASQSDLVVINSCGVIERTERKILRRVKELQRMGKEVIMTGCLPSINPHAVREAGIEMIAPIGDGQAIQDLIAKRFESRVGNNDKPDAENFTIDDRQRVEAVVKIANGCLGNCSYCATKNARGNLKSRYIEAILGDVESAIAAGSKEIRLTAQDTAVFGMDNGSSLPFLLTAIGQIPGQFRVRVGMMNPLYTKTILEGLIEAYDNEVIYKFLHVPLQSGDDEVLKDMNRGYTVDDFKRIISKFRGRFDDLTISTDVIVGYPTESEDSFRKTYEFLEEIKPDIINITRFSPRPWTRAYELKDMSDRIKKERSRKFTILHKSLGSEINAKLVGKELGVLVTEPGKNGTLMGRTDTYKTVILREGKLGDFMKVRIKDATSFYLVAE
ncbi:MAG: tRNA (N(6)-L-threonylcarbamoyladenosine(37)-C(2))-methylthiotransferase [Candidatus Hydrothermarchaeales archaeon]